ncbi:MAG TPA: acyl carrier protein [Devosia sp.]|jgi:acyl carrier protein|nr:acyl carrier protein [Devosia sp.]
MSSYEQPILDFISGVAADSGGGAVTSDTRLLETGVLDSINLVRLIQFMEERFGIQVPDSDFGPELFESPASLAAYVERRVHPA